MHRNTVTYQLTKIRELLNMDTEDAERSELPRLKKTLLSVCRSIRKQWILAAPVCGVGEIYEEPLLLRRSADEAGRAAGMNSREPVTLFEELGIFRLLAECPDQEAVREFAVSRLKPLLDYDLENRKNLLQTLETYHKWQRYGNGGTAVYAPQHRNLSAHKDP